MGAASALTFGAKAEVVAPRARRHPGPSVVPTLSFPAAGMAVPMPMPLPMALPSVPVLDSRLPVPRLDSGMPPADGRASMEAHAGDVNSALISDDDEEGSESMGDDMALGAAGDSTFDGVAAVAAMAKDHVGGFELPLAELNSFFLPL